MNIIPKIIYRKIHERLEKHIRKLNDVNDRIYFLSLDKKQVEKDFDNLVKKMKVVHCEKCNKECSCTDLVLSGRHWDGEGDVCEQCLIKYTDYGK